jgi:hypothetical protein
METMRAEKLRVFLLQTFCEVPKKKDWVRALHCISVVHAQ